MPLVKLLVFVLYLLALAALAALMKYILDLKLKKGKK